MIHSRAPHIPTRARYPLPRLVDVAVERQPSPESPNRYRGPVCAAAVAKRQVPGRERTRALNHVHPSRTQARHPRSSQGAPSMAGCRGACPARKIVGQSVARETTRTISPASLPLQSEFAGAKVGRLTLRQPAPARPQGPMRRHRQPLHLQLAKCLYCARGRSLPRNRHSRARLRRPRALIGHVDRYRFEGCDASPTRAPFADAFPPKRSCRRSRREPLHAFSTKRSSTRFAPALSNATSSRSSWAALTVP